MYVWLVGWYHIVVPASALLVDRRWMDAVEDDGRGHFKTFSVKVN